jgi:nicotinate phosphoribosyltransferase
MSIVTSLIDTDIYKINMMKAIFYKFPDINVKWVFKCRTPGVKFTPEMVDLLEEEINDLCKLRFTEQEIKYIGNLRYHANSLGFLEMLRMFKLNRDYIHIEWHPDMDIPKIWAEGPAYAVELFEIHILQIFEGIWFAGKVDHEEVNKRLDAKIKYWKEEPFYLTEFGTRRRASWAVQAAVVEELKNFGPEGYFSGTSNIYFAREFDLTVQGTFAHSFIEIGQGVKGTTIADSQKFMWDKWSEVYDGDIGLCLTDTLGWDKFERDFGRKFANAFTGVRHDSGDPFEWGNKMIGLYKKLGVDPYSKTLLFSDSLDFEKARALNRYFKDRVGRVAFGIGTYLTNDTGLEPLNIVMKIQEVNGLSVAKISDASGKTMCENDEYLKYLRWAIKS